MQPIYTYIYVYMYHFKENICYPKSINQGDMFELRKKAKEVKKKKW